MNLRDLALRARALLTPASVERDLHDELSFHIERETMKLIEQGLSPDEARAKAQASFGSTTVAADECRDERGTAFIDNTVGGLQYALRTFRRAPLATLTIVITVAIGLGLVAVLFTVLNVMLFRTDHVPDVSEIYAVERPQQAGGGLSKFTRQRFEALRSDTNVFSEVYAAVNEAHLRVDGRVMSVNLVSASFFRVVRVNPMMGRALSAADDDRAGGNPVLVLSDKGWQRRFNRDPNVIGRTVLVSGAPYEIVGVMPEGFRGLEVSAPDAWAPLARVGDFVPDVRGSEANVGIEIIGRLKSGLSRESARAQLAAWDSNQSATVDRTMSVELSRRQGTVPEPLEAIALFTPLFLAFGLILVIGCANVANLLLARGLARQREIGIRLSIGASRRRIVRQLLTESVMLALAAAGGGYLVSRLSLEGAVYWTMRTVPVDVGDVALSVPAADWRVALFLVLAAIAATAFFALLPALHATRIEPATTLRGELVMGARPGRARNVLIGLQVFASALLLICSAIFLRSAIASSQFNPGFRTADTVLIDTLNEDKREALLRAIGSDPTVTAFAGVRPPLLARPRRAFADSGAVKIALSYKHVSAGYFDVIGVPIVRGRAFTTAEHDEHPVAVVSESVARTLWPNSDGVGKTFRVEADLAPQQNRAFLTINPKAGAGDPPLTPRTVTVIGVSKDAAGFRLTDVKEAGVFLPTTIETPKTVVVARIRGDADLARQALLERLTRIDPNLGNIITLRTVARLETFLLTMAFWVSVILGGLALLLTVSGLFSVLSYLVEQRTREIGVRIALGASSQKVTQLMLAQTTRPVLFGLLAGAGLAASLATFLLATEVGGIISQIVHVTDPVAYLSSVLVIVIACLIAAWVPASRAARVDPMNTLRQE
ncbi:MAG TPA: ABC transporter permease [Vicinamibacterales bacterium]|nr:ABC transporter permease [Vicinamibacterales bacterium]